MSNREAAPLTVRLLARKRDAVPSGSAQPATAAPRVQNVHTAPPTVHTVDLTPPDFLRTESRGVPAPAQKPRDDTS